MEPTITNTDPRLVMSPHWNFTMPSEVAEPNDRNESREEAVGRLGEPVVAVSERLWTIQFTPNYCECLGIEYPPCDECRTERLAVALEPIVRLYQQAQDIAANHSWRYSDAR